MDLRRRASCGMAVLGLGLVVGGGPATAGTRPASDSTSEAIRAKKPARTPDSTTPPSTVTVKPSSSTTAAKPTPARSQVPHAELPTTTSPLPAPVSGAPAPSAGSGPATSTTTGPANPHVVEEGDNPTPVPAFGQAGPTTTSTEVSSPVVGSIGTGPKPTAPARQPVRQRPAKALGATGASTRPLVMLAGGSLLLGALALAFGESGPGRPAARSVGAAPGRLSRRNRRVRRALPGWESGVPLAPDRREQVRQRIRRRQGRSRLSFPGAARGA